MGVKFMQGMRLPPRLETLLLNLAANAIWWLLGLLVLGIVAIATAVGAAFHLPPWVLVLAAIGAAAVAASVAGLALLTREGRRVAAERTADRDTLTNQVDQERAATEALQREAAELQNTIRAREDELRQWRVDGSAGRMLQQAQADFVDLALRQIRDIAQLLDYVYRSPFTEVPLEVLANPNGQTSAVSLAPVATMIERPNAEVEGFRQLLRARIDQVRNQAHQDARGPIR